MSPSRVVAVGRRDERAVSPVVGATLLVGIVVLLAAITAAVFLDLGQEREPAPDVAFGTDRPASGSGMVLVHRGGTVIDGANLELRGVARPDGLTGEFASGDGHRVFPTGERVEIVWYGERTSYVLWEFDVSPDDRVSEPDEDCSFVDAETAGGTDAFDVEDTVVGCAVETSGQIDTDNVTVLGRVESTGEDVDAQGGTYYGDLLADGQAAAQNTDITGRVDADGQVDLDLVSVGEDVVGTGQVDIQDGTVGGAVESRDEDVALQNVTADGGVTADTAVDLDTSRLGGGVDANGQVDADDTRVGGPVTTAGQVDVQDGPVDGPIDAGGDASVQNATVAGSVTATTQVDADDVRLDGGITAGGQVDVQDGTVDGSIDAGGDASVQNVTVTGTVASSGDVDLDAATIEGDIDGAGQVDLDGVTVEGDVDANTLQCDDSTVNGQDCDDYSPDGD